MSALQKFLLDQDLTIYNANDIKQRLTAALAEGDGLELDLTKVSEMDTAGVQLLLFLKKEAQRLGKEARIVGHSAEVRETLDFLSLTARLGEPTVVPPGTP